MNTKLFSLIILLCFFSFASSAEAYLSQSKTAEVLKNDFRLYSINFKWAFAERDLLIPVLATRGIENGDENARLGYELMNTGDLRVKTGTTTAIVVADLPIENGYYRLKAGTAANFKLLALHQSASSTQPLKLQVTSLPFKFDTNGKETKTFLREHELKGYVTNSI